MKPGAVVVRFSPDRGTVGFVAGVARVTPGGRGGRPPPVLLSQNLHLLKKC